MQRIAISVPGLDANPMVVMRLLRALGGSMKVRDIAAALSRNAPLLDEELPNEPVAAQLTRLRALMQAIDSTAVPPHIVLDGRPVTGTVFREVLEAAERMLTRRTPPA